MRSARNEISISILITVRGASWRYEAFSAGGISTTTGLYPSIGDRLDAAPPTARSRKMCYLNEGALSFLLGCFVIVGWGPLK